MEELIEKEYEHWWSSVHRLRYEVEKFIRGESKQIRDELLNKAVELILEGSRFSKSNLTPRFFGFRSTQRVDLGKEHFDSLMQIVVKSYLSIRDGKNYFNVELEPDKVKEVVAVVEKIKK